MNNGKTKLIAGATTVVGIPTAFIALLFFNMNKTVTATEALANTNCKEIEKLEEVPVQIAEVRKDVEYLIEEQREMKQEQSEMKKGIDELLRR